MADTEPDSAPDSAPDDRLDAVIFYLLIILTGVSISLISFGSILVAFFQWKWF